jgi:hypothetical protein
MVTPELPGKVTDSFGELLDPHPVPGSGRVPFDLAG